MVSEVSFHNWLGPITLCLGQGNIIARVCVDMCRLLPENWKLKRWQEYKMPANRCFRQKVQQAQESDLMGYGQQNYRDNTTQTYKG